MLTNLLLILVSSIFVNNFLLSRFLGECPFLGVSKQVETATGMSVAVVFVMTMTAAITYLINYYILVPFGLEYLQIIAFIVVIASLVQFVEMVIKRQAQHFIKPLASICHLLPPTALFWVWRFSTCKIHITL